MPNSISATIDFSRFKKSSEGFKFRQDSGLVKKEGIWGLEVIDGEG